MLFVIMHQLIEKLSRTRVSTDEVNYNFRLFTHSFYSLGNKQDMKDAVDELDMIEYMKIMQVVNFAKTYTRVEICSCYPDRHKKINLNKNIDIGFS